MYTVAGLLPQSLGDEKPCGVRGDVTIDGLSFARCGNPLELQTCGCIVQVGFELWIVLLLYLEFVEICSVVDCVYSRECVSDNILADGDVPDIRGELAE